MPSLQTTNKEERNGSLALIGSALAFSLMTVCVKQLNGRLPVSEIVFIRAIISFTITRGMLLKAKVSPWGQQKTLLFIRGILGTAALFFVFKALELVPLASATVIQYTYPTFTAIAAFFLLGERLRKRILIAVLIGWLGIIMIVNPEWIKSTSESLPTYAVSVALTGALLTSLAYVCVRKLSKTEHPLVIIYYFPLVSLPLTLPFFIGNIVWPTGLEWIWLIGVGLLTQLGQIWITKGLSYLPAARACAINYIQVVFAAIWGVVFFKEALSLWVIVGAIFILGSTLISLSARNPG
ncbi:DMT family transporter [Prochlorococcus sp. MIT 1300]|uniref:DMT family transporter n=1 Tax=Prochlorococcus sp. MIT 1300 TaxID=3096218 RepID=UPI0039BFF79D